MKEGSCRHFNGAQNKLCARGVAYKQFEPGIPCIKFVSFSVCGGTYLRAGEEPIERRPWKYEGKPCPLYEEASAEEIQRERAERDAFFEKTKLALATAATWRVLPKPSTDRHEVVECPVCKGALHLSQSSYNGHVHGKCETAGCVSWME